MTSIEWLIEQLEERGHIIPDHLEQNALIMEKDQICLAYFDGQHKDKSEIPSKYYQQTFKNNNND
jgi:hypothetical protein